MELKKIYLLLLKEAIDPVNNGPMSPPGMQPGAAQPLSGPGSIGDELSDTEIIEIPEINMNVSLFPAEKKLLFSAEDHSSMTRKTKKYVDILQQNFRIIDIRKLSDSSFEVELDPREDFQSIINFLMPSGMMPNVPF